MLIFIAKSPLKQSEIINFGIRKLQIRIHFHLDGLTNPVHAFILLCKKSISRLEGVEVQRVILHVTGSTGQARQRSFSYSSFHTDFGALGAYVTGTVDRRPKLAVSLLG